MFRCFDVFLFFSVFWFVLVCYGVFWCVLVCFGFVCVFVGLCLFIVFGSFVSLYLL